MEISNNLPHIMDAHSQVYFQSIEDVDSGGYLVDFETQNLPQINVVGVENPTIGDVVQDNSEGEILNKGDCSIDDEVNLDGGLTLGKVFATQDDAYDFYNSYALSKGFGIRKSWVNKSRVTGEVTRKKYVCNKEGFKNLADKRQCGKELKRRRETRTGCKAMMKITLSESGEWILDKFFDVHNHALTRTPSKRIKHRSHCNFHRSMTCKALIAELNQTGLKPSQISRAMNAISCGQEVDITPKQCSSYLSTERKNNVGQECYNIIKYFQEKAVSDGSHYFAMDLATNGSLRSVFWADGRSRASYSQFGDDVVFDVTYKTNKFRMPFASFIGVNHHRQSILFGVALLEDEAEVTLVWLFEQFLKCMFDRLPIAIITDMDGAMRNAIKKVFSNARHCFCLWNIKKHVMEHLQSFRSRYSDFNETYTKWVKSETIAEFESRWKTLNGKYVIEEKSWLTNIYNLRQHWVNAYLKNTFFAGMTTSGRSKSIHAFFDGYVNSNTMLNDFVVQYDKAIKARRDAEEDEDFKTMNSKAVLDTMHPIEEKAGECYTRNLFEIFKKEWKDSIACFHETLSKDDRVIKYSVGLHVHEKYKWKIVEYDSSGDVTVSCTCSKFEAEGMLCKHILYIMRKKKLTTLPKHYILPRWTINSRYQVGNVGYGLNGINITPNENGVTP